MAFKSIQPPSSAPDSPERLFLDLPRRKIPSVLPHQKDILSEYESRAVNVPDVALELPTGSGKTLVGLLLAEWRRRKFQEKVVYLCPTKQLVNQVVELASDKYGISICGFTGKKTDYKPIDKTKYMSAECVAVTTYSSLFNTNPFFDEADVLILDDAHAAESYIAKMWSILVERENDKHASLHAALSTVLRGVMEPANYVRLQGKVESPNDRDWVDKLPTPVFMGIRDQVIEILDEYSSGISEFSFTWPLIRDHLAACHLYVSAQGILIRPLLPPTSTHGSFISPKQRIYMSATLGSGGDLERLTGRYPILRLSVDGGWDSQGVGRRFFIFPDLSLNQEESEGLKRELMKNAGRSLVLVPSDKAGDVVAADVTANIGFPVFRARDIESAKKPFVSSANAVAVVANRYDGIDFPGEECRALFVEGLPRAVNMQERFLMSRMGALALLNERVRTRVLQAIGRCTRSLEDYSSVIVSGGDLSKYLSDTRKLKYLHPELQAELQFGIDQSKDTNLADILDNFKIFLENGKEWEIVNQQIVSARKGLSRESFPGMSDLEKAVPNEIAYQKSMWQGDYESALGSAEAVLGTLCDDELRGYRALWHYLAGAAAMLASGISEDSFEQKGRDHFGRAKKATTGIAWLVGLSRFSGSTGRVSPTDMDDLIMRQVEGIEEVLIRLGTVNDRKFAEREKKILDGLLGTRSSAFEDSQKLLGEILGFDAGKEESEGSPDPWWVLGDTCLVFEDHSDAYPSSSLDIKKARQVSSHPEWIRDKGIVGADAEIIPVLVTPVKRANAGALPHLKDVSLWPMEEFRDWSKDALACIREMRVSLAEPGDIAWRNKAADMLRTRHLDAPGLFGHLRVMSASNLQ